MYVHCNELLLRTWALAEVRLQVGAVLKPYGLVMDTEGGGVLPSQLLIPILTFCRLRFFIQTLDPLSE